MSRFSFEKLKRLFNNFGYLTNWIFNKAPLCDHAFKNWQFFSIVHNYGAQQQEQDALF